ncbi:AfsR/SARP family transcriptional regulator [Streptomyces fulvoviolaceus]|uniref:AfsR/SARP family transcriptional regulator n=1 Tax=Streptomyces fulvoviolaceus TaxID=285535 RepID=UPI000998B239|nr:bacterial transcriptional activator domain-containing protein [Streptomyces fulvoviolaceus]
MPGVAAALAATAALALPRAEATPLPRAAGSAASTPVTIDSSDPDLALPAGTTLAQPKILDLTSALLSIDQLVEADSSSTPRHTTRPGTAPASSIPGHPGTASDTGITPRPSGSASAVPPAPPSASKSATSSSADGHTGGSAPAGSPPVLPTVLGAGALLSAAITGALAWRRLLRRRTPGSAVRRTPQPSPAPAAASAPDGLDGLTCLAAALRSLADDAAKGGAAHLPALSAARIGSASIEVLPAERPRTPPAPFTAGPHGWWTLPPPALLRPQETARPVPAPYPALVTIGSSQAGDLLLLNLTQLPVLLLEGTPAHVVEVLTSLALELSTSPLTDDADIVTVGFAADLPQLKPSCPITPVSHPAEALQQLTERLLEAHQTPRSRPRPFLLLSARPLDTDTCHPFADLLAQAPSLPVALVAPAGGTALHFPGAHVLNASTTAPQTIPSTGCTAVLQRLDRTAYRHITTSLADSEPQKPRPAAPNGDGPSQSPDAGAPGTPHQSPATGDSDGDWSTGPAPAHEQEQEQDEIFPALRAASRPAATARPVQAEPGALPGPHPARSGTGPTPASGPAAGSGGQSGGTEAGEPCAPEIRVLGPVEVDGVPATGHGPRVAQLAALLYFRPGRTADALRHDMDPHTPWTASTLNARLQELRRALGNDSLGNPYVPRRRGSEDPYRLSPAIRCDWTRFTQLTQHALPHDPAALSGLEQALTLVRGRPFDSRPLPWAEPFQQEITTRIVDVAHTIAAHRTPPGPHHDLTRARQAIATGLDADHTAEILYRDWMHIEAAANNRSGLHTAITRLQEVNRQLDCPPQPETEQLIHDLLTPTHTTRKSS